MSYFHPNAAYSHLLAVSIFCALSGVSWAQNPQANPSPVTLDTVEIVGRATSGAYHGEEAAGAKSDLPLRELPQSVRVITRQAVDDLGATKLDDVLDYVGGVSRQTNFGGLWDNIVIRGMPGDQNIGMATLFNGFSTGRGFNAPRDLAGVERVEFLKGTAAALYGSSEPGGTLNTVSKRPLWKAAHSVELYAGSHGLKRAAVDSTAPLSADFSYRLNIAAEEKDGFRDYVSTQRKVMAPAFTWRLNDATTLEYVADILEHKTPLDRGVVAVNGRLGQVSRRRFFGEPNDGKTTIKNQTHQFIVSHDWNIDWRSRLGVSYRETSIYGFASEAHSLQPNGDLWRQRRFRDFDSDDIAGQAELQGLFQIGMIEHELLLGIEQFSFDMNMLMLRINPTSANPYPINIWQPVYGTAQPAPGPNQNTHEQQRNSAFYVQDALKLSEHWRILAGVRVDNYRQSMRNHLTNTLTIQKPSANSPRIGLSWLPNNQWTLYANAGRSFRPNSGTDITNRSFSPERGRAVELGSKWENSQQNMGLTAALFDIRKRNVLTTNPADTNYSIAAGEVQSRGVEFDFSGQVARQWRLNASLMFNEVEVIKDNHLEVGGRLLNVPKINGSVLAVYEGALLNGQRYSVGGGLTHTGKRLGQARTQAEANAGTPAFELPAYTTAKLVAYWHINPRLNLTLDIDNVFDRTYYISSYNTVWVAPGTPRSFTVGAQIKF